jgi:TonB family protein
MALSCLLFTSDEGAAKSVRQALSDLGVDAEHCTIAVEAVQKVTNNPFNLLIVDWDNQTEAAFLVKTARERKVSERPLTLAIVSQDQNVSQALQAGANSILRKPIVVAQLRDSLASARDLLRSRQDASGASTQAAAAAAATGAAVPRDPAASTRTLRAGEFLQPTTVPGTQFVTEADVQNKIQKTVEEAAVAQQLRDLVPVAAAVESKEAAPAPPPHPAETRGLSWYMKARAAAAHPTPPSTGPAGPEVLGYDQTPSETHKAKPTAPSGTPADAANPASRPHIVSDHKSASVIVADASGESSPAAKPQVASFRPWLRRALLAAALIAVCLIAYVTVPPERWHQNFQLLATNVVHIGRNWLNPQTPATAPVSTAHENFGLAGDEYKLPVAENIPDATTDPAQIRVVPVTDPTAKQPSGAASNAGSEDTTPTDNPTQSVGDQPQTEVQVQETAQPSSSSPVPGEALSTSAPPTPPKVAVEAGSTGASPANVTPVRRDPVQPAANARPRPAPVTSSLKPQAGIPSSLRSQMAPTTPDMSGNRQADTALPSIEPVNVPEATARGLLLQQSEPEYPATAKGQQGRVLLQVLVGRDGSVQDAKFLQGSLAFARPAIDAVKQWHFKPYNFNGRPVSIQTVLTLTFKPGF